MGNILSVWSRPGAAARNADADAAAAARVVESTKPMLGNPGSVGDLHKCMHDIQPKAFDGAILGWERSLDQRLTMSHTVFWSSCFRGYRFGTTYLGTHCYDANKYYPIMSGNFDVAGNLNVHCTFRPSDRIQCTVYSYAKSQSHRISEFAFHYFGPTSTTSLTVQSPNALNNSTFIETSYLKTITPRLVLGIELIEECGRAKGPKMMMNGVGRFAFGNGILEGTLGMRDAHISYYHYLNEFMQMGIEFESSHRIPMAMTNFVMQLRMPKHACALRGSVDTNGNIVAIVEKRLLPLPIGIALCAYVDHGKQIRVGCSISSI